MSTPLPSSRHQAALSTPTAFTVVASCTFIRGDDEIALSPVAASFVCDRRRSMWWSGQLTMAANAPIPTVPSDLLTPFGTRVEVELGVELADGTQAVVPFGVYLIDQSKVQVSAATRSVEIPLIDFADRIAAYRFERPFRVPPGTDVADVVNLVVTDRLGINPGLAASGNVIARQRIFGLDPELDPWREMQDLCKGFGWVLHYDRGGRLTLDTTAVGDPSDAQAVVGAVSVAQVFEKRPANVVVVRAEPSDDTPPVWSVAMDEDPLSPMWAGTGPADSPYGRRTRYYASPNINTQAQADSAAAAILAREAAAGATWTVTRKFDPTKDPGDVLSVPVDDPQVQSVEIVVDSVAVDVLGETVMECRSLSSLVSEEP